MVLMPLYIKKHWAAIKIKKPKIVIDTLYISFVKTSCYKFYIKYNSINKHKQMKQKTAFVLPLQII